MILPEIKGQTNIAQDSFYFAADNLYLDQYGKALAKSLKKYAPWSNIHIHIFNPTPDQLEWCSENNITCSYESVDTTINELRTYYACVRFIRVPEIFSAACRVISLDCDGIVIKPITKDKFINDTNISRVLWREKKQTSLASSVFYGPDDFRVLYANRLRPYFENDGFQWFLDQTVMDVMIQAKEVAITASADWGSSKIRKDSLIWTGKGDRKLSQAFQDIVKKYK